MKPEEEIYQENLISYVDNYYYLTLTNEKKGIRQLHHDFNKQKSNLQTSSHKYSFIITLSENSNGLASTIFLQLG